MLAHDFLKKDDRTFGPPTTRSAWYFFILVLAKICRCIGVFFVDILAKQIHVVGLLCFFKLISSAILLPIQRPFSVGRSIRKSLHVRIGQLALFNCLVDIIWFYGITFCGPLRSILVFEQNPSVILIACMSFVKGSGSSSKTRGVICLIIGYLVLFVMDSDVKPVELHAEAHKHQSGLNHIFYHIVGLFGISDHKGGVVLLMIAVFLKMAYDSTFRHLAVEVGGPKRLYSMISILSALFLVPLATLFLILSSTFITSYSSFIILLFLATLALFIVDFYAESICFQHVADPVMAVARWSPIVMFLSSLLISWIWYENAIVGGLVGGGHAISSGLLITILFFCIASYVLTAPTSSNSKAAMFVGISEEGMPLYTHGEAFLQRTSKSLVNFCRETLKEVLSDSDSRRIFWFLCANLAFCSVEFCYGFLTNSLGLISDGFHMLFDCSALVMGLIASVMARWTASRYYSYGYGRVEVLSGFINALFLIVIAFFIFMEALERLYDPPNVQTDKLMFVAVAGLLVNLFGMYAFHGSHGHSHGGESHDAPSSHEEISDPPTQKHSHSHSHSHGHSHGGNANMQGVFLHVLADTLGSVFVIISTLLIQLFGWQWVDPLCSLILSILILGSVYPLLRSSASILLQNIPDEIYALTDKALDEILHIEGVLGYTELHIWQLKSGFNVATIHLRVVEESNNQIVRQRALQILKKIGANQITIQVEKEAFSIRNNNVGGNLPASRYKTNQNGHAFVDMGGH